MDLKTLAALERRGYAGYRACLKLSALTSTERRKLIRAIQDGLYPARRTLMLPIYEQLMEYVGAPAMSVCKSHYGWRIVLNPQVPQETRTALAEFRKADRVAYSLANEGKELPVYPWDGSDGPNHWEISFQSRRNLSNVRALSRLYADTPEYKHKVAGVIEVVRKQVDLWI